jgi:hypothetical protein
MAQKGLFCRHQGGGGRGGGWEGGRRRRRKGVVIDIEGGMKSLVKLYECMITMI